MPSQAYSERQTLNRHPRRRGVQTKPTNPINGPKCQASTLSSRRTFPAQLKQTRRQSNPAATTRAAKQASTRDTSAQTRRRISLGNPREDVATRHYGEATNTRNMDSRLEAPPRSDAAADCADAATPVTNTGGRDTPSRRGSVLTRRVAQRVTIPIYRRDAAHRACPTQGGGGSSSECLGLLTAAPRQTRTDRSVACAWHTRALLDARPRTAATARAAKSLRRAQGVEPRRQHPVLPGLLPCPALKVSSRHATLTQSLHRSRQPSPYQVHRFHHRELPSVHQRT